MSGYDGMPDDIHYKIIRIRKNGEEELTEFVLHSSLTLDHFLQAAGHTLDISAGWAINADGMVIDDLMYINDNDIVTLSQTKTIIKKSTSSNSLSSELNGLSTTKVGPYSIGEFLGKGGFGAVYRGIHDSTNEPVALKFISKSNLFDVHDALKIQQECQTLLSLKHPNIIHMYAREETSQHWVLAFELMEGGDLHNYLCKRGGEQRIVADVKLTNDEAKRVFQQIVGGISYAHSKYIIHRDLKLENIFLLSNNLDKIKIGDFGLSALFNNTNRKDKFDGMGTLYILPPEVFQDGDAEMGCHFDVWALGVLLYTMLSGRLPFSAHGFNLTLDCQPSDSLVRSLIVSGKYEIDRSSIDPQAVDLIRWMLHKDPLCRATVHEIITHPWFFGSERNLDSGETTQDASLDTSTTYHSSDHRRFLQPLPMISDTMTKQHRGEVKRSGSVSTTASGGSGSNSSFTVFKGGKDNLGGRKYSDSLLDELDKSTHSQSTGTYSQTSSIRRAPSMSRTSGTIRISSWGDKLDQSVNELRSLSNLQRSKVAQSEKIGGSSGGGGTIVDRFTVLSQSAKANLSTSGKHLASLDDKLDTLGQSLHEAACVRNVDPLSKSMHQTYSSKGLGSTSSNDLLSQSMHQKKGYASDKMISDLDDDLPLMKSLLKESSMTALAPRRKGSYMDSTQTSVKIPSHYK